LLAQGRLPEPAQSPQEAPREQSAQPVVEVRAVLPLVARQPVVNMKAALPESQATKRELRTSKYPSRGGSSPGPIVSRSNDTPALIWTLGRVCNRFTRPAHARHPNKIALAAASLRVDDLSAYGPALHQPNGKEKLHAQETSSPGIAGNFLVALRAAGNE
jgi:hypothetical protein